MSMDGVVECKFDLMTRSERFELYPFLQREAGDDWLEEVPVGWWDLVEEACRRITAILTSHNYTVADFQTLQIKEKYGELRWYFTAPDDCDREIDEVMEDILQRSSATCNRCGRAAEYISTDWILPWCHSCYQIYEQRKKLAGRPTIKAALF